MDKLGLLSLQVPILASSTETADGGSSVFMAAAEALPTRYVSPDIEAAAAAADVGPEEHGQVQGETGSVASFAAADASSSCSSCFWEDNSSSRDSSRKGAGNAVVTGVNYWIPCSETTSAPKFEAKRSVGVSPRLLMSEAQGESEWQQATPETQLKGASACPAAAAGLAAASTAAEQKEEGKGWDPVPTRREEEFVQDINMKNDCLGIGAASVERCSTDEPHAPGNNGDGSASQDDVNSPAHAAAAASIEMAAMAPPKASVLDAVISSKPDKRQVDDSAALHAAVAGSCSKLKGGSADDSVCGTGTPTTRFSTEQEEDSAAAPAIPHRDAVSGGAAAGSGPEAEERGGACSSSDRAEMLVSGEVATQPLSYEKPPPSEGVRLHGADAAAAAEETEVGDMDADQQQAQGGDGTTVTTWHHGTQEGGTDVGETQTQQQPFCQADASLPDNDSFLRDDVAVGNLLAAAAAVVEQHVHALSAGIGAVDSQKGSADSEETQVATTRTATDESLERTATVLPNVVSCLDAAEGLCGRTAKGYGTAGRSSGGLAVCVKSELPGPGSQTSETVLSLTPALDTALLEASHEAGILPSSSTSTSSEERSGAAAAETRERDEGTGGQGQRGKKQTPSGERVVASQALPDDGTRGAAPGTPGGGGGRAVGTRGAAGASQQQQQTNGSSGCAAALPEDPELVESLKSLLRALPRKKDAEAKWLLSGEMPFVRPYALQIVDVWKIHLGEAGRTALKKDISERTQADASLKKQVLAICKLKMAKLEVLVQIAEVADLLPRTLQIANDYEVDRQVASVTRQSASRRALSAAVTASSSQHSSVSSHSNSCYAGSNACDVSAGAGGSSTQPSTVGTGTGRMPSSSAQIGVSTRHSASSFSPSRASLSAGASPPAERSPGGHRLDAPSPGNHNMCRTSVLLSPRAGTGAGGTTSADEYASISDERSRFCYKGSPSAKENSGSSSSSPTAAVYESREESACSRPEGLSVASLPRSTTCFAAEGNGGARVRSPRASSESRYHVEGVPGSPEDNGESSRQLQHLQQQQHQQQHMHGLQQHERERARQQPLCGSGEEEGRCSEAEVNFVAHDLRETLNLLQQGGTRMHPGRDALPLPSSAAKVSNSRSERMSPSKEWTERMDLTRVPELQQGNIKKKLMLPQPRHSQQTGNYVEKDEDAIRAAELLAAFAELRSEISSGSHANQQAATDISTSSTMAHDDLLNVTLEAAAAGVVTSPRARALIAALSDSNRLARIPELPGFPCLDRDDNSDDGVRRRPQEHEVLTLLRLAGLSGDEAAATAFAGQLLCAAAQGSTSNSSSSSEAEGAPLQELDCEVGPADLQTVRRKRARRSNKSGVRSNNRNRSAANSREVRVDENHHHALQLQQLHQQLQQQQLLQVHETGNDLPAALAGERQTCMNTLEPAVVAGKEDVLRGAEKPNCKKKRSCQTSGEDSKLQGQDPTQDEDTEEEDGNQVKTGGGPFSRVPEAAALLQSVDRSQDRYPSAGHPAAGDCTEGSSGGASATASGSQSDNGCKGTFPLEHDDRCAKVASARGNALSNSEKEGNSGGAAEARTSNKSAGVRLSRRTDEEAENGGGNGTARCSEERTTAADAAEERTTDVAGRSAGTRPAGRSDVDLENRSSTASRSLSRNGTHRCNPAADGFPGAPSENSSFNRGRNGVRQGRENLWGAAPYTTRRSAAAAAGASHVEGGDSGFTDAAKNGSSKGGSNNGGSRLAARGVTQGEIEGKVAVMERHEIEGGSGRGPGDSVAEQCAREAKQLLERALKVNDALGFVPASCRLTISGTPRDHEASTGGSNIGTGTRAKRAREQVSAGEWDTGAFLQVLATVCLMYLKQ